MVGMTQTVIPFPYKDASLKVLKRSDARFGLEVGVKFSIRSYVRVFRTIE
jgi:hypothetical protein